MPTNAACASPTPICRAPMTTASNTMRGTTKPSTTAFAPTA